MLEKIKNLFIDKRILRKKKLDSFQVFWNTANETFEKFYSENKENLSFSDYYQIDNWTTSEKKYIDIYFKSYAMVNAQKIYFRMARHENGVRLRYNNNKFGDTICLLSPANTGENNLLKIIFKVNTLKLMDKNELKRHWNIMCSYMNMTSIVGNPNICDIIHIYWLLFTRRTIYNGIIYQRKCITYLLGIIKFSLTVGLSGFWLLLIQKFF